ncbi:MAG: low specificity L-threonine aldolase, partial [Caldisericota bacterium]|nr:low specificity L-threonine aldolase [Caldisericota bacterium]
HANARLLASELAAAGFGADTASVETNMAMVDVSRSGMTAAEFKAGVRERGVLCNDVTAMNVRLVTHHDVTTEQCHEAVDIMASLLKN